MVRASSHFVCQSCGAHFKKWAGQCSACGAWNSITEEVSSQSFSKIKTPESAKLVEFTSLKGHVKPTERTKTNITELDRVLGGGLVAGSTILIGGDPGIGKSTLMLQMAAFFASRGTACAYVTGEESTEQIRMRAERLGLNESPLKIASATSVANILRTIQEQTPDVIIIDSIQTMYLEDLDAAPGTVSQVRSCSAELINTAKQTGTTVLLVGHVTKEGQIAGPKVLEHMVDTVLYFEGERGNQYRILRAVKNRFGGINEIGVFEMTDQGLKEVTNPSSIFISGKAGDVSGSVIFAGIEGTRPVLVEIQALVSPSPMATPRRAVVGWDANRLAMILAVLQTRCAVNVTDKEVYLNIAGGIRIAEPAADLAVAAAIFSSLANVPIAPETVIFGEVGLSGEVRPVIQAEARLKESEKLGFSKAITPPELSYKSKSFQLTPIPYIKQLETAFTAGN